MFVKIAYIDNIDNQIDNLDNNDKLYNIDYIDNLYFKIVYIDNNIDNQIDKLDRIDI